ncbi:phosphoethanolamine transferase [Emticicia sp. SJ17W-69]|uniref:phosphoethanolamine transferase n=1 Tax=Emticicia sp. SJ17W-69 TaxID=3421657 RepID=UPI003EC10B70
MFPRSLFAPSKSTATIYFFITIFLICISDFVFFLKTEQYSMAILGGLACLSLQLLPVFLFKNRIKLYLLLLTPVFILLPFNLGSILLFGVPANEATILLLINTNFNEASELMEGYWLRLAASIFFYVVGLLILLTKAPNIISKKSASLTSAISLIVLFLVPLIENGIKDYFVTLRSRYYTVFPTSLLYSAKMIRSQYQLVHSTKKERENFKFNATQDSIINGKQVYVLVIGESSRYDHWGINGYERNTSPNLSKRENLISFNQVAAGGFITEYAIPLLLTGVGAGNFDKHYQQKSIVSAFKEAGFSTYWLTNQIDEGHISLHIEEAENPHRLVSDFRATKNVHRDMELVHILNKVLKEPEEKKFIVLHLSGSHYDYSARYPDEFDVFKPSNKTVFSKSADKKFKNVLVNSYDNTIVYSDAVIDSVISMVSNQNALSSVSYISDHGENLFDDNRDLSQHAYPVPSKYISHIPFFVWYSPILEKTFPQKIANLKLHKNKKISSENIIHTLTSLSGIVYSKQDSSKNITSLYYKNSEQLILGANRKVYRSSNLE